MSPPKAVNVKDFNNVKIRCRWPNRLLFTSCKYLGEIRELIRLLVAICKYLDGSREPWA